MKNLALITIVLLATQASLAAEPKPLLTRYSTSGLVSPPYDETEACLIFADRVEIRRTAGSISVSRTIPVQISGDIVRLLELAAEGEIVEEDAPTDGPITEWRGILPSGTFIPLQARGSRIYSNRSDEAATLINVLDQNCR
jgi:hypothetical protein